MKEKVLYQAVVDANNKFIGLVSGKDEKEIIEKARSLKLKRYGILVGNRLHGNMSYRKKGDKIY
jgi:hypothetical protein